VISPAANTLKTIIAASLGLLITGNFLKAGPPFDTDDPEPVGFRHWEYYLSSMNTYQPGFITGTLPHIEINYGFSPGFQVHMEAPLNFNLIENKTFQYGYSVTELGIKYRFFKSRDESFQAGIFPIFEVPTVKSKDFPSNGLQVYLPVWIQKSWKKLMTYGGAGYWFNPGPGNKNWVFAGWEVQYDLTDHLTLGGELFYRTPQSVDTNSYLGFNLGGFINFTDNLHLIFSFGHSITRDRTFMSYVGILVTI
jgi:hypothetical protein